MQGMDLIYFIQLLFSLVVLISGLKQSALYRNPNGGIMTGNFSRNENQYLWAAKITSLLVADTFDCAFVCVNKPSCFSFNMAVNPESNRLYLCELLSADKYRATDKLQANSSFHHYSPWFPQCESSPCKNGAFCVPDYESSSFHCDCKPAFVGSYCECRASRVEETCSHIKSCHPSAKTGSYLIDPGSVTPFSVECDMTDKNGVGVTIISHDSEGRTLVDGYSGPASYSRDIHYTGASLSQLASLIEQSAHCEQFIEYDCYGSKLLYNGNPPHGWWVSRDGFNMKYWGGVTSGDYKCACGVTNSCADPDYGCNCDKNDERWREDSGFLTNKSDLPVRQLILGDTGTSSGGQRAYYTLKKLRCYGIAEA